MSTKVMIAVDLSDRASGVIRYGFDICKKLGAEATFFHVLPDHHLLHANDVLIPPDFDDKIRESALKRIIYEVAQVTNNGRVEIAPAGSSAEGIITHARENGYDMIIIGEKGHGRLAEIIMGGTVIKVCRYAHCPVLVYRELKD